MATATSTSFTADHTGLAPPAPRWVRNASVVLAVTSALAAAGTAFLPDVLSGTEVMNGSARGTALAVLLVATPALVLSMRAAGRGSVRALVIWAGAVAYLTYNAVMFAFATPFNELFLLYVAMLGTSIWVLIGLCLHLREVDLAEATRPPRWVGWYVLVIVTLNTLLWLARVVPAVFSGNADFLDGTGLTTNPVFVQDLSFWLPAMAWVGLGLLGSSSYRWALGAAGLVFWVVEAVGVALDQWLGHVADPASAVASGPAAIGFAVLTAVGLVPAAVVLSRLPPAEARLEEQR